MKGRNSPNGDKVWSVAFSFDGAFLATASYASHGAIVYETFTWNEIARLQTPQGRVVLCGGLYPQ